MSIEKAGYYKGFVTQHAIKSNGENGVTFEAQCDIAGGVSMRAFLKLVSKDGAPVESHLKNLESCYGWDRTMPDSLQILQDMDLSKTPVSFKVVPTSSKDPETAAKYPFEVAFINPDGGGEIKKATPDALKSLQDRLSGKAKVKDELPAF